MTSINPHPNPGARGATMTPATLYDMGLPVIPATTRKAPAVRWREFQTRVPTRAEFDSWTGQSYPVWGLVTGTISKRVVLDFDGEEGLRTLERVRPPASRSDAIGRRPRAP
jgi:hypothetical protein